MPVTINGTPVASNTVGAATSLAVTNVSGIVVGELLLTQLGTVFAVSVTPPSGWTLENSVSDGFGSTAMGAFIRIADGGEGASATYTFASAEVAAVAMRIGGQAAVSPINAEANNSATSGSTTAMTCPSVTTTVDGCMIVRLCVTREATSIANPASHTAILSATTGSGSLSATVQACYQQQTNAGASGTADFVATGNNREWATITLAIAPGPVAAPASPPMFYPKKVFFAV